MTTAVEPSGEEMLTSSDCYPCTPASIEAAKLAADAERQPLIAMAIEEGSIDLLQRLGVPLDAVTAEQWSRVDAIEALTRLVDRLSELHGQERVRRWLHSIAGEKGGR